MSPRATGRYEFGLTVAGLAVAAGVLAGNAAIFLSAIVPLSYVAYGYATRPPTLDVTVDRTLEKAVAAPGETVAVTLSVTNETAEPIPDLRIADDPPADLAVEGRTRAGLTVQPAETVTLEYDVVARRGEHGFGAVTLVARNASGSLEVSRRVDPGETVLKCDDVLESLPLAGRTNQLTGRVSTDEGGEGLEFHSVRAFHPTDPMNRVDWNRLARTGELTTIEFREERAASVVVVVDSRETNALARGPREPDARELSRHAAGWVVTALLGENNRVGVACYGGTGNYLLPRSGRAQATRAKRVLDGEWCGSYGRNEWLARADRHVDRFCRNLADEKQIVFVTPALDAEPVDTAERFRAYGHPVTVISPSITQEETTGGRLETLEHRRRLRELREYGVRVVSWNPDDPLHLAVERAARRWSR